MEWPTKSMVDDHSFLFRTIPTALPDLSPPVTQRLMPSGDQLIRRNKAWSEEWSRAVVSVCTSVHSLVSQIQTRWSTPEVAKYLPRSQIKAGDEMKKSGGW